MNWLLLAQRALSGAERFVVLPLFVLLGLVLIGLGVKAIVEKRIGARPSERLLYGKQEWTGGMAVLKGVVLCIGGVALIVLAIVMVVLGRTLLPG